MKIEIGKTYLVKKDIFGLKKDELWTLVDKGYQAYFGEHNFVFVNDDKVKVFAVLQDGSEEIYKFTIIWMTILKKSLMRISKECEMKIVSVSFKLGLDLIYQF